MTGGTVSLTSGETSLLAATMIDTPNGHLGPWVEVVERIVAARLAPHAGIGDGSATGRGEDVVGGGDALRVGSLIHGFAGCFGRDSYECRVIEAEGADRFVTRNTSGETEFITKADAALIGNPGDRSYCAGEQASRSCIIEERP